jgi:hypothetical protein
LYPQEIAIYVEVRKIYPIPLTNAAIIDQAVSFSSHLFNAPTFCIVAEVFTNANNIVTFNVTFTTEKGNCTLPAPFWGTCCRGGKWQSNVDKILDLSEFTSTPTQIYHNGSLTFNGTTVLIHGSDLTVVQTLDVENSDVTLNNSMVVLNDLTVFKSNFTFGNDVIQVKNSLNLSSNSNTVIDISNISLSVGGWSSLGGSLTVIGFESDLSNVTSYPLWTTETLRPSNFSSIIFGLRDCYTVYDSLSKEVSLVCSPSVEDFRATAPPETVLTTTFGATGMSENDKIIAIVSSTIVGCLIIGTIAIVFGVKSIRVKVLPYHDRERHQFSRSTLENKTSRESVPNPTLSL